jgi:hypothetical protein
MLSVIPVVGYFNKNLNFRQWTTFVKQVDWVNVLENSKSVFFKDFQKWKCELLASDILIT